MRKKKWCSDKKGQRITKFRVIYPLRTNYKDEVRTVLLKVNELKLDDNKPWSLLIDGRILEHRDMD